MEFHQRASRLVVPSVNSARAWHCNAMLRQAQVQILHLSFCKVRKRGCTAKARPCPANVLTLPDTRVDEEQPALARQHMPAAANPHAGTCTWLPDGLGANLLSAEFQSRAAPLLLTWQQDSPKLSIHTTQRTQELYSPAVQHESTGGSADRPSTNQSCDTLQTQGSHQQKSRKVQPMQVSPTSTDVSAAAAAGSALVKSTSCRGTRRRPAAVRAQRARSVRPTNKAKTALNSSEHSSRLPSTGSKSYAPGSVVRETDDNETLPSSSKQPVLPSVQDVMTAVVKRLKRKSATVLTRQEEHVLARCCKDWITLMSVRATCRHVLQRNPTAEEMARSLNISIAQLHARMAVGRAAKNMLVQCNKGLVCSVVQQAYYRQQIVGMPTSMHDLMLEGTRGLLHAIQKFEPDKGLKLSTYAIPWIRQYTSRVVSGEGYVLNMPLHIQEKVARLTKVTLQLSRELQRKPTDEELLPLLGWSAERLQEVRRALVSSARSSSPVTLDSPVNDDEGSMSLAESLSSAEWQDHDGNSVRSTASLGAFDGGSHVLHEELVQLLFKGMLALLEQQAGQLKVFQPQDPEADMVTAHTQRLLWATCTGLVGDASLMRPPTGLVDSRAAVLAALAAVKVVRRIGFTPPEDLWLTSLRGKYNITSHQLRKAEVQLVSVLQDQFGAELADLLQDLHQNTTGSGSSNIAPRTTGGAYKKAK